MTKVINLIRRKKFLVLLMMFFILIFSFNSARAYSIDNPADALGKTNLFEQNPLRFSPIDLTKFLRTDRTNLTFQDLIDVDSFSFNDLGASAKAILVLFLRLIITTLNATLGIFQVLLEVLGKAI